MKYDAPWRDRGEEIFVIGDFIIIKNDDNGNLISYRPFNP
jgi:hypothetical protein